MELRILSPAGGASSSRFEQDSGIEYKMPLGKQAIHSQAGNDRLIRLDRRDCAYFAQRSKPVNALAWHRAPDLKTARG